MNFNTFEFVTSISFTILCGAVSLIFKLLLNKVSSLESEIDELQKQQSGIKSNYLDRFEKLTAALNESRLDIITNISVLSNKLDNMHSNFSNELLKCKYKHHVSNKSIT